jgi:Tol biopolymer transport system component
MNRPRPSSNTLVPTLAIVALVALTGPASAQHGPRELTNSADVGRVLRAGSTTYDPATGVYLLAGSGANVWAEKDAFHFASRRMKGDFILTARGGLVGTGVDPHRKFGWMARSALDSSASHVSVAVHGDGLTSLQFRRTAGAATEELKAPITGADVIQLERRGNRYTMSVARYGDTLVSVHASDIALGDEVHVGLFVTAHNDTVVERARLTDVRLTVPAKQNFVPYRDYIGGNIEILEVATGTRRVVFRSPAAIQAPNWTPDGKALIYNEGGKLYRFDLAASKSELIETGFATRNNNDHVLSFDGNWIGISHHSADDGGRSLVYVVPITGGTPRRVTAIGPSYLHGWSPDGRYLLYTGVRGENVDIYRIPAAGGSEKQLTRMAGMNDGSEYGRDGRIYFNSTRTGIMQLWRMGAEGGGPRQLTNDGLNNWFPHISPDSRSLVFLSYLGDVLATDHPWYRQVYLRRMPSGGGPAKVIAYVYGGQGTINVPSWSPDGRFVAFVANTDRY